MPTRNVNLTPELESFVLSRVESGRFENASEVVRAALRTMEREEQLYSAKLDALRAAIDEGDASGVAEGDVFAQVRGNAEVATSDGEEIVTLKELLGDGRKAVFVGFNPSLRSVKCGHYYQGALGLRFWDRLRRFCVVTDMPRGAEDDAAYKSGFGFTDLVRTPTKSIKGIKRSEMLVAVKDLGVRLGRASGRPRIILTFKGLEKLAKRHLTELGYEVLVMPSPYEKKQVADANMKEIQVALGISPLGSSDN